MALIFNLNTVHSVLEAVLNPWLTGPAYLALCVYSGALPSPFNPLGWLLGLGVLSCVNSYLNDLLQNNSADDTYDWSKELVVVTGGSGGIGGEVVNQLRDRDIKVVNIDIVEPKKSNGDSAHFVRCDLASAADIASAVTTIQARFGNPTVLINVAGTWNKTSLLETSNEATAHVFAVNILAPIQLIKSFAPTMVKNNHGIIALTTSAIGYGLAPPAMTDYAATKAGLIQLHEILGSELALRYQAPKIRTVLIVPFFVKTPLTTGLAHTHPTIPALETVEVGTRIVEQVLKGRSGQVIIPKSLGWTELMVRSWPLWLQKVRAGAGTLSRT